MNQQQVSVLPFAKSICVQRGAGIDESIACAQEERCSCLYLECSYEDGASSWSSERITHYARRLRNLDLGVIVHGNYKLPLSHESPEVRAAAVAGVKQEIDLASAFDAPVIVHGSSIFTHRNAKLSRSRAVAAFCESVTALAVHAERQGVDLWLENLEFYRDRHPFYTVFSCEEDYAYVLDRVQHTNVRFILDVGHENVGSGEPTKVFGRFRERIVAIDMNDNDGTQDSHLGLGRGRVDYAALLSAMIDCNWSGHLTLETRGVSVGDDLLFLSQTYERVQRRSEVGLPL